MITSDSTLDFNLRKRLDELSRGECSEDDFLQDVFVAPHSSPDAAWDVLSHIDQHYRRGHLSQVLFRSIESKIARQALKESNFQESAREDSHYGQTVDLESYNEEQTDTESSAAADDVSVPIPVRATVAAPAASPVPIPNRVDLLKPHGAADVSKPGITEDWTGRVIADRYVIEGVLGDGGMGRVFKALDRYRCDLPNWNRHVALKVLHQRISEKPDLLVNLRREFFCAQALSHQNIVNVFETGRDADVAFFTMELLDGELLSAVIGRSRPRPIERSRAFEIIRAIGAGLSHAHSRNVVHADLKPHNVMITKSGEIRILDFGASRPSVRRGAEGSRFQCSVTPAYACCELLAGKPPDPRDDLFALACLSFELLSGRHPFGRRSSIQARDARMRPERPDGLTGRQWRTLRQGIAWRRADRSMSVDEWVTALTDDSDRLPAPKPEPTSDAAQTWWRSAAAQRTCLWAGILMAIGLLVYKGRPNQPRPAAASRHPSPSVAMSPAPAAPVSSAALPADNSRRAAAAAPVSARSTSPSRSPAAVPADESAAAAVPSAVADAAKAAEHGPNRLTAIGYHVQPGQGFAEVSVRRSDLFAPDSRFVWWTVEGSAVAGSDFVPQMPTSQMFSPGRHASNVFVRLLPNPLRTNARDFHVEVGKQGDDDISAPVARATIRIPPPP